VPMPHSFDAVSVAADSRVAWAAGGFIYEGAVELWEGVAGGGRRCVGYGWTEAVGWDRRATRSVVATALRQPEPSQQAIDLLSSRAPHSKPPPN
jgi:hypothetical protein